jgi:hypothetical protein
MDRYAARRIMAEPAALVKKADVLSEVAGPKELRRTN